MTKYFLTSVHYKGSVVFYYDNGGFLTFYSVLDAELDERTLVRLLQKLPREEGALHPLGETGFFTIRKVSEDLSFESFWEVYDKKIHPNRCEPAWKKLSDAKRLAALKGIGPYDNYLTRKNIAKANPEKYLKWEYWKTDWSKEI